MDPTHHDIIVDKLLQYWGKLPDPRHLKTYACKKQVYITQTRINDLVKTIENLANDLKVEDFS
jgi:sorbitol-specific phosphotransferase system component IIBC